jgi:N-methylhydantoinase A
VRLAFDVGGTFTDVVAVDASGRLHVAKLLSLLSRIGDDVAAASRSWSSSPDEAVAQLVHATTIGSNAVIEGTTAPTGLLTTRGFRDVLEMRGQRRPNVYDVEWDRLPPLVPRRLRREVDERIRADGGVDTPLDEAQARGEIRTLRDAGVEVIAVCLLHAYAWPDHERRLGELIADEAPDLRVCLSSAFHPEIREDERSSTTVVNASLMPVLSAYLDRLESQLAPLSQRLLLMQSNGGLMTAEAARRRPAYVIESGPAAGVLACARLAQHSGLDRVLAFDMGGTTAKACLVDGAEPLEKPGGEIGRASTTATRLFGGAGHALRVPSLDIVEVGAGGGSVAWVDGDGVLHVGPRSAGAEPGPVCYGRGGQEPTVTDANAVLGYMARSDLAGGTLPIDVEAARGAVARRLARPLGLDVLDAAFGVHQIANATMLRALRAVSTERGRDPREYALVAFGGAGPLHAAGLAESMGISTVHVPLHPGLFSALGLLLADFRHDALHSVAARLESVDPAELLAAWAAMESAATAELRAQGVQPAALRFQRRAELRYAHEVSDISVEVPRDVDAAALRALLEARFVAEHETEYGFSRDEPVQVSSLRVRASAPGLALGFADLAAAWRAEAADPPAPVRRPAYFGRRHGLLEAAVTTRHGVGSSLAGPAIVDEPDSTTVVPPGWTASVDESGTMVLRWSR